MKLRAVRDEFLARVGDLTGRTPAAGVAAMVHFYRDARVAHCPPDEDGDVLVFQWGVYDWGDGERFEVNVTRELMTAAGDGDEDVRHLSLTFRFPADAALRAVGEGEITCDDPADADEFLARVRKEKAFAAVAEQVPEDVAVEFDEM